MGLFSRKKSQYVDFVSDEHFINCVKWVCDAYPTTNTKKIDMKRLGKNGLDVFKMVFDMNVGKIDFAKWLKSETVRQADKTINNKIGEFHQKVLGGVNGWEDLQTGNGIDIKKKDNTIFVELKNKHNTVKGEDLKNVFDKLKKVADENPGSKVYYAYITPKHGGSGECVWNTSQREPQDNIMEAWGSRIYEIVTKDRNALKKTWEALPKAIAKVLGQRSEVQKDDMKRLVEFFEVAFH